MNLNRQSLLLQCQGDSDSFRHPGGARSSQKYGPAAGGRYGWSRNPELDQHHRRLNLARSAPMRISIRLCASFTTLALSRFRHRAGRTTTELNSTSSCRPKFRSKPRSSPIQVRFSIRHTWRCLQLSWTVLLVAVGRSCNYGLWMWEINEDFDHL